MTILAQEMKKKIKDAVATGDYGEVANLSDEFMALILDSRWEWAEVARDLEAKIATSKDVGSVAALSLQLQRLQVGGRWQDWGFQLSHSEVKLPQIEKRFREHVQGLFDKESERVSLLRRYVFATDVLEMTRSTYYALASIHLTKDPDLGQITWMSFLLDPLKSLHPRNNTHMPHSHLPEPR